MTTGIDCAEVILGANAPARTISPDKDNAMIIDNSFVYYFSMIHFIIL